jgi:hypothetical protein
MPENTSEFHSGDGIVAVALRSGIPVLHMLNIRRLTFEAGIPWDPAAFTGTRSKISPFAAAAALGLFAAVLALHRRWEWETGERG